MAEQLDKNEIINSGMLELYVAGALSEEESQQVHLWVKSHPDLLEEVQKIEEAFMKASASSVKQKPQVNTVYQVLNQIEAEKAAENKEDGTIIDLLDKKEKNDARWLLIAAAIALVLSVALNLFLYFRFDNLQKNFISLKNDLGKAQKSNQKLLTTAKSQGDYIALLNDSTSKVVELASIAREKTNSLTVVYDKLSQKLAISQWSLASLTDQEAYQLWAIYGDEVVSLGVLPKDPNKFVFKILEREEAPTSFAISYEPNGESPTPTEVIMLGDA